MSSIRKSPPPDRACGRRWRTRPVSGRPDADGAQDPPLRPHARSGGGLLPDRAHDESAGTRPGSCCQRAAECRSTRQVPGGKLKGKIRALPEKNPRPMRHDRTQQCSSEHAAPARGGRGAPEFSPQRPRARGEFCLVAAIRRAKRPAERALSFEVSGLSTTVWTICPPH